MRRSKDVYHGNPPIFKTVAVHCMSVCVWWGGLRVVYACVRVCVRARVCVCVCVRARAPVCSRTCKACMCKARVGLAGEGGR
jgi:hypothetical protein